MTASEGINHMHYYFTSTIIRPLTGSATMRTGYTATRLHGGAATTSPSTTPTHGQRNYAHGRLSYAAQHNYVHGLHDYAAFDSRPLAGSANTRTGYTLHSGAATISPPPRPPTGSATTRTGGSATRHSAFTRTGFTTTRFILL